MLMRKDLHWLWAGFFFGGRRSGYFLLVKFLIVYLCRTQGGEFMTPIVKRTKHGDTIFVSHPTHAAKATVAWATQIHGCSDHCIKTMEDGCVKVEIPGLTSITYAPDHIMEI
jgi:hypothetical protein